MTLHVKEDATGGADRGVDRNADCDEKATSSEKPLKPTGAASIIEAMATFTAVAELLVLLVRDHSSQHSNMIANVLMEINQTRERCKSTFAKSLRSTMPPQEARDEIERLRSYEARMLAKKRKEMSPIYKRADSNLAKRSQGMGPGPAILAGAEMKARANGGQSGKTKPNALSVKRNV